MIQLIGVPFDANSSFLRGTASGPSRIRLMEKDGSANVYTENDTEIKEGKSYRDFGDMSFDDTNPENLLKFIKTLIFYSSMLTVIYTTISKIILFLMPLLLQD